MKVFVITLVGDSRWAKYGEKVHQSALKFGYDSTIFNALRGSDGKQYLKDNNIRDVFDDPAIIKHQRKYIGRPGLIGCFTSHHTLWNKCIKLDEPIIILEHDALIIREWPEDLDWQDVLHLKCDGSMRHGQYIELGRYTIAKGTGVYDMNFSVGKPFKDYVMSTTFAYAIKPHAAQALIHKVKTRGRRSTDRTMSTDTVRIQTINPSISGEQNDITIISTTSNKETK